jgi:predicted 3-demethylubiquinone-9 3-methyltransferase (glyoxalase superfamily)
MNAKKAAYRTIQTAFEMKKMLAILLLNSITISCTDLKTDKKQFKETEKLKLENDSLKQIITENKATMGQRIITSLTFQKNDAEQAMNFYVSLFDNSKILNVERWGKDGQGKEGTIMQATFELNGQKFMFSDSPPVHNWDFTPAIAIYVECKNEEELERLFTKLSENGKVAMPLNNYGFSQKFGWVIDKFGVSWELNLN